MISQFVHKHKSRKLSGRFHSYFKEIIIVRYHNTGNTIHFHIPKTRTKQGKTYLPTFLPKSASVTCIPLGLCFPLLYLQVCNTVSMDDISSVQNKNDPMHGLIILSTFPIQSYDQTMINALLWKLVTV